MSNFATAAFRDLTCVAVAAVITLLAGAAFVQSTSTVPAAHTHALASTAVKPTLYT